MTSDLGLPVGDAICSFGLGTGWDGRSLLLESKMRIATGKTHQFTRAIGKKVLLEWTEKNAVKADYTRLTEILNGRV